MKTLLVCENRLAAEVHKFYIGFSIVINKIDNSKSRISQPKGEQEKSEKEGSCMARWAQVVSWQELG